MGARFEQLEARAAALRALLLPPEYNEVGDYDEPEKVEVLARSYVVLCHAEVETYLEDRAIEIAKTALKNWKEHRTVSLSLLCLLGFSSQKLEAPPATLLAPAKNQERAWGEMLDVTHRVENAVQLFVKMATQENHGVKQQNILRLLLPIGFPHDKLDSVKLGEFDSFGSARGAVAHGALGYVRTPVDPKTEEGRLQRLLAVIKEIDVELDQLL